MEKIQGRSLHSQREPRVFRSSESLNLCIGVGFASGLLDLNLPRPNSAT